jgi:hypothetical protein
MLTYAILAFVAAALGGLVLASSVLRGKLAPWALSLAHAGLGALGLVLTAVALLRAEAGGLMPALVVLVVAALGGFYLASIHLRGSVAPKAVVAIHAGAAVLGVLLLASAWAAVA